MLQIRRSVLMLIATWIACWSHVTLAQYVEQRPYFTHQSHRLSAYFKAPSDNKVKGVVVFVSGDGAIPYDAHGYYEPIWQVFLDAGYAVFSWDKPGVGKSSGNWLEQSMSDRQDEVRTAIEFVKRHYTGQAKTIGLMGFSQAGWVAPALMQNSSDVNFMVGVGYAINWLDQSWYLTQSRLQREGAAAQVIARSKNMHQQERSFWHNKPNYEDYVRLFSNQEKPISKARFGFIKKNVLSDAEQDYIGLHQPMMILLGDNDEQVDTTRTFKLLHALYREQSHATIKMIPNATHGLLNHPEFNSQTNDIVVLVKIGLFGERVYAPGFFEALSHWLDTLDTQL